MIIVQKAFTAFFFRNSLYSGHESHPALWRLFSLHPLPDLSLPCSPAIFHVNIKNMNIAKLLEKLLQFNYHIQKNGNVLKCSLKTYDIIHRHDVIKILLKECYFVIVFICDGSIPFHRVFVCQFNSKTLPLLFHNFYVV